MIAAPLGEIGLAVATLRHLAKVGQLDAASLAAGLDLIDARRDEIEVLTADTGAATGFVRLPVVTLADIGRGARAADPRRGLACIDGGRP